MSLRLIRSGTLPDGTTTDLLVRDGVIVERGAKLSAAGAEVIDADGLRLLPGLVDLHTHLREPGFEGSETVLTGSRAAAAGGFTAVHAMANTSPVQDSAGVVEQVAALGDAAGYVTVRPVGAVTMGLRGEQLAEIGAMARSRAAVRVFSDDGKCVHDALLMRRALEYVATFGGVLAQHAQEPRLTEGAVMNEGELSSRLGLAGWPAVAEESIIARDVLLAEHVGARLHVCHLSTAGSVDIVRWAKARGIAVTAEVTPHHLLLTEELIAGDPQRPEHAVGHRGYDTRLKVNPPLRRDADVQALREGVADGTIDIVATDHAPHPTESKECAWAEASFGMVGLETALSIVHRTLVDPGHVSWEDVARIMSTAPAAIGRVSGYDAPLTVGSPAHVALYDPTAAFEFSAADVVSRSRNSPYLGESLPGRIVATLYGGVVTVRDGAVVDPEEVRHG